MNIVLTFFNSQNHVYQRKLKGMQRFAIQRKWHIENITGQEQTANIGMLLDFWKPIGCIVEGGDEQRMARPMFGTCPVVYINHRPTPADQDAPIVQLDGSACAELAVVELAQTNCIYQAYVHSTSRHQWWSDVRAQAFARLCTERKIPHAIFAPTNGVIGRTEFIRQLRPWLIKLPSPCGIFAANDEVAAAVATACSLEGLSIPRDISIIGVDDDESICLNTTPELSSVRPNFEHGCHLAAELLDRLVRKVRVRRICYTYQPIDVVRRGSTRAFSRKYPEVNAVLELIRQKACAGLTAREALKTFSCSRRLADLHFREVTGKSVLESIQDVRLAKIQELLANPRLNLELMAGLCGYETQNALRKFFKARTGMSLTAWRRLHFG